MCFYMHDKVNECEFFFLDCRRIFLLSLFTFAVDDDDDNDSDGYVIVTVAATAKKQKMKRENCAIIYEQLPTSTLISCVTYG